MRVLCSTTAGDGHFGPLKVLAQACRAAGHEVRVAAPASFAAAVQRAGLDHAPFADAPAAAMGEVFESLPRMSPVDANRTVMADVFGRLDAQAAFPDVLAWSTRGDLMWSSGNQRSSVRSLRPRLPEFRTPRWPSESGR